MGELKSKFNSLNELHESTPFFWQFGRFREDLKLIHNGKNKPYLLNKNTLETIKGLKNINNYLKVNNILIENF